jgi:hypothetical protein
MQKMASTPADFYSDSTATGGGACPAPAGPLGLAAIFQNLAGQFSAARLIPNNMI